MSNAAQPRTVASGANEPEDSPTPLRNIETVVFVIMGEPAFDHAIDSFSKAETELARYSSGLVIRPHELLLIRPISATAARLFALLLANYERRPM